MSAQALGTRDFSDDHPHAGRKAAAAHCGVTVLGFML
jgi:hypothetical protein